MERTGVETVHRADRDRTIVFRVRNRNAVVKIFRASFERQQFRLNVRVRPIALPDVENSTAKVGGLGFGALQRPECRLAKRPACK